MVMGLYPGLVQLWRRRLEECREELARPEDEGHRWVLRMRVRVLAFLVSRYAAEPDEREPGWARDDRRQLEDQRRQEYLRFVIEQTNNSAEVSGAYGPKSRDVLREKAEAIRSANREKPRTWWERFLGW